LVIKAEDVDKNPIGQTVESYTISVPNGQGKISDGAATNNSIQFDNFSKAAFIYQAPTGVNLETIIKVTPTQNGSLLAITPTTIVKETQKKIRVAKGIITISNDGNIFYKTNTQQNTLTKFTVTLPKDESDIQYEDSD
jgi:hypothetical protein